MKMLQDCHRGINTPRLKSSVVEKSIEVLVRRGPVMVQMRVVERWDVFRVRASAARSRGPKVEAVAGS